MRVFYAWKQGWPMVICLPEMGFDPTDHYTINLPFLIQGMWWDFGISLNRMISDKIDEIKGGETYI
jgi:hypothetical protein